jgi:hypothetical protein
MSFVVVDSNTRCAVRHPRTGRETYQTEAAARAAKTRMERLAGEATLRVPAMMVMTVESYRAQVPMREVVNLMTGAVCLERADTPWHCSVGSESYWSA